MQGRCALDIFGADRKCAKPRCVASGAAADEGGVFVVGFARDAGGLRVYEFQFTDEGATPGMIDAAAEFALHALQLLLPGFAAGGEFEQAVLAAHRLRVGSERVTDNGWPCVFEPSKRSFGSIEAAKGFAEEFSGAFHGGEILAWYSD